MTGKYLWCGWRLNLGQSILNILQVCVVLGVPWGLSIQGQRQGCRHWCGQSTIWNCNTASWVRTNWNYCWTAFAQTRILKRHENDALSHIRNSTQNIWNLAKRILILRLGLLGLRDCHVWAISPTIWNIVGFYQVIDFTTWSALLSEPLSITDTQDNTPLGQVLGLISSTTRRVQRQRPRDASMQR